MTNVTLTFGYSKLNDIGMAQCSETAAIKDQHFGLFFRGEFYYFCHPTTNLIQT